MTIYPPRKEILHTKYDDPENVAGHVFPLTYRDAGFSTPFHVVITGHNLWNHNGGSGDANFFFTWTPAGDGDHIRRQCGRRNCEFYCDMATFDAHPEAN
jgi:hypothetical protein